LLSTAFRDALECAIADVTIVASVWVSSADAMIANSASGSVAGWIAPNRSADHAGSTTCIGQAALACRTWAANIAGAVATLASPPHLRLGVSESHGGEHPTAYGRRESLQRSSPRYIPGQGSRHIVKPTLVQSLAPLDAAAAAARSPSQTVWGPNAMVPS
jgi:hypothetical protein